MGRLVQQYPNNYHASGNVSAEFENVVRYLVSSERGNRTLGELMRIIFDEDGNFHSDLEIRNDTASGAIQYRIGTFSDAEAGWQTIVDAEDLRGEPGQDVGLIPLPIIHGRADYVATAGQTEFDYVHLAADELLIYVNGVLKRDGALFDYTHNATTGKIIFNAGLADGDAVTAFRVRADGGATFTRTHVTPVSDQVVFPFVFPSGAYQLFIYKNGILLREGGSYDYIPATETSSITFTSTVTTADTITFLLITPTDADTIPGIMLEERYVDPASGNILYSRLAIDDDDIPQAKIFGLVPALADGAKLIVSATTPVDPDTKTLWLDTSIAPNQLKFYDGTQFISTSPESAIPPILPSNAGQYVRVNGTGTGLIYDSIDFSAVIPRTEKGSSGGVASLDSTGRVPVAQLPEVKGRDYLYANLGATVNGAYTMSRLYGAVHRVVGISAKTTSGTCQIQIKVAGVLLGNAYAVSSTTTDQVLTTPIEIDASTISKTLAIEVTNASSVADLEVTLAIEIL